MNLNLLRNFIKSIFVKHLKHGAPNRKNKSIK